MADMSLVLFGASDQKGEMDGPFYLTNGPGWSAVISWATSPAAREFPKLRELAKRGSVKGTDALGIELAAACVVAEGPPRGVLEELAERIGVGDAEEKVIISDGENADNDKPLTRFAEPCDMPRGLLELPDVPQEEAYDCGAASAMSVGRYFHVGPESLAEWRKLLGTNPEDGTPPDAIARVLRDLGLSVEMRQGMTLDDLKQAWKEGAPVITPIQDYGPDAGPDDMDDGHWVVVCAVIPGYVVAQDSMATIELEGANSDAAKGKVLIEEGRFMEVWHDQSGSGEKFIRFGLVVRGPR